MIWSKQVEDELVIDVFHADELLQLEFATLENERMLVALVLNRLDDYQHATRVKHPELDIAFAATGGPTVWVNVDNMMVDYAPTPARRSEYGDILVEQGTGYVNLSTPSGFIPLVDVIESFGTLVRNTLT